MFYNLDLALYMIGIYSRSYRRNKTFFPRFTKSSELLTFILLETQTRYGKLSGDKFWFKLVKMLNIVTATS